VLVASDPVWATHASPIPVDVNLLLYAVDADLPLHQRARAWWEAVFKTAHDEAMRTVASLSER